MPSILSQIRFPDNSLGFAGRFVTIGGVYQDSSMTNHVIPVCQNTCRVNHLRTSIESLNNGEFCPAHALHRSKMPAMVCTGRKVVNFRQQAQRALI
jgi:hypothetical protein